MRDTRTGWKLLFQPLSCVNRRKAEVADHRARNSVTTAPVSSANWKLCPLLPKSGFDRETQETPSKIRTSRSTAPSSTFNAA
jgi:hypothetical protein